MSDSEDADYIFQVEDHNRLLEKQLEIAREGLNTIHHARTEKEPGMSVQSIPMTKTQLQILARDIAAKMEAVQ